MKDRPRKRRVRPDIRLEGLRPMKNSLWSGRSWPFLFGVALILNAASISLGADAINTIKDVETSNIHAMIVSSSRYWFNYRHAMNALGIYEIFRENGIPDDNIILMIADEYAVNGRNPYKNRMHASGIHRPSWYSNHTQIDYRGSDVTVQMFLDALLGHAPKSLHTNENSNLLIYVTGHGGDQFFKFQDEEELTAQDIATLMDTLYQQRKFRQSLFIADTCQAFTLFDKVTTPNVLALGTSLKGENAYAHHSDKDLGLAVIERWTHAFLGGYHDKSKALSTLHEIMVAPFASKQVLGADIGIKEDKSSRGFKDIKLYEFFGPKKGSTKAQTNIETQKVDITKIEPITTTSSLPQQLPTTFKSELFVAHESKAATNSGSIEGHNSESGSVFDNKPIFISLMTGLFVFLLLASKM